MAASSLWLVAMAAMLVSSCGVSLDPGESGSCNSAPLFPEKIIDVDSIQPRLSSSCDYEKDPGRLNCKLTLGLSSDRSTNVFPNLDTNNLQLRINDQVFTSFERARSTCNGPDCYTCTTRSEYMAMGFSIDGKSDTTISLRITRSDSVKKAWIIRLHLDTAMLPKTSMDTVNKGIAIKVALNGARRSSRYAIDGDGLNSTMLVPHMVGDTALLALDSSQCKQMPYPNYFVGSETRLRFRFAMVNDSELVRLTVNDSLVGSHLAYFMPIIGPVQTFLDGLVRK